MHKTTLLPRLLPIRSRRSVAGATRKASRARSQHASYTVEGAGDSRAKSSSRHMQAALLAPFCREVQLPQQSWARHQCSNNCRLCVLSTR